MDATQHPYNGPAMLPLTVDEVTAVLGHIKGAPSELGELTVRRLELWVAYRRITDQAHGTNTSTAR